MWLHCRYVLSNVLGHIKLLTHCPISVKAGQDLKIASDAETAPGQVKVSCAFSPRLLVGQVLGGPCLQGRHRSIT